MNCSLKLLTLFLSSIAFSNSALAQFQSSGNASSSQQSTSVNGVATQADNTVDTFDGLTIKATRLIKVPSQDNTYRLILSLIETQDIGRRAAVISPKGKLIDDVGNVYELVNGTGLPLCIRGGTQWLDVENCPYYLPTVPNKLLPSQPTPMVFTFVPSEDTFSQELTSLATQAALHFRLGVYSEDLKNAEFSDIVINSIALPKDGS